MVLNGFDGTIISRLQSLDSWYSDLGNPSLPQIGLLNASGFMSGIVAGPLINFIDDRFGRRWGIRCASRSAPRRRSPQPPPSR